jgi:probable O-glycosylation ligase (exosortase A-associated)
MALKGRKVLLSVLVGATIVVGPIAINFLPEKWISRQQSVLEYEQDKSATSRLGEWTFCWRVANDRPLVGGGFHVYSEDTYARYYPEFVSNYGKVWSAHSIYFGILAEHGFPGLTIFLAMMASCFASLYGIKRSVRARPDLSWLKTYCDMIQVSLLGFLVNGAFVEMEYFDLVYHWVGVVASLKMLASRELAARSAQSPDLASQVMAQTPAWQPFGSP